MKLFKFLQIWREATLEKKVDLLFLMFLFFGSLTVSATLFNFAVYFGQNWLIVFCPIIVGLGIYIIIKDIKRGKNETKTI